MHLEKLGEKNNIYHNDFIQLQCFCNNCDKYIENKNTYTVEEQKESFNLLMQDIEYLQHYNIFIVIDKCVIIDFEASCRKKVEKKYFRIRGVHETMLELDRE